jgi:hypothetical protein
MLLSELTTFLTGRDRLAFTLPDGTRVPAHFHITEVGEVSKRFVDCGGTQRHERTASLQLWSANDYDHRLHPEKLVAILEIAKRDLGLGDLPIEVEYQGDDTIQKFGLSIVDDGLRLASLQTDCLAKDRCGIPDKPISLNDHLAPSCAPGSGCC